VVFGNQQEVGLEVSIEKIIDRWVYGRFLLWLDGNAIGSQKDFSVDLRACFNWLSDLVEVPRDRSCPELMDKSNAEIWQELVDPVFEGFKDLQYAEAFSRFHISHIGMSSFDTFVILLINDDETRERYIWQQGDQAIQDYTAKRGTLEDTAKEAISWFDQQNLQDLLKKTR